jgi:photosystem II S4 domain protein
MRPPAASLQQLLRRGSGSGIGITSTTTAVAIQGWRRRLASPSPSSSPVAVEASGASSSLRAREAKLGWVSSEHRKEVAQCVEMAERASERWTVAASPFVTPPAAADAVEAVRQACGDDVAAVPWGGFPQAERCRVVVGPRDLLMPMTAEAEEDRGGPGRGDDDDDPDANDATNAQNTSPHSLSPATRLALEEAQVVAAAHIKGQFLFDPATHRDFLGAVLGTGISRDKVGDIVAITERGATVLIDPVLVEHLERELTSVRSVPVTVSSMPLSELRLPAPKIETLKSVEASMRLDAIASAGFRTSRAKMTDLIKSGDVKLQWKTTTKASAEVKQGDVVSVAGKGRLEVVGVSTTKNGRFAVEMVRRS